jgi:thiamine-monophosphate kinase
MQEFSLIETFFAQPVAGTNHSQVVLGIGDDAAILDVPPEQQLLVSTDTLVSGVHFFPDVAPADLAYKVLAVNLSDMAAMGATPAWVSLALTLPKLPPQWLSEFARSFMQTCEDYQVALIGGDTTSGPLSISVTIHGLIPRGQAVRRDGAQVGDDIYVSGTLGDAAAGLNILNTQADHSERDIIQYNLLERLLRPTPRVLLGKQLRGLASSCLDVSDGLAGDIKHILKASFVGAQIDVSALPYSSELLDYVTEKQAQEYALTGGDDYELCFTAPKSHAAELQQIAQKCNVPITKIGHITESANSLSFISNGQTYKLTKGGYEHQF